MKTKSDKLLPQLPNDPEISTEQQEFNRAVLRVLGDMNKDSTSDLNGLDADITALDARITVLEEAE